MKTQKQVDTHVIKVLQTIIDRFKEGDIQVTRCDMTTIPHHEKGFKPYRVEHLDLQFIDIRAHGEA